MLCGLITSIVFGVIRKESMSEFTHRLIFVELFNITTYLIIFGG